MSALVRLRNSLILLLAGRSTIVVNVRIVGGALVVERPWSLVAGTRMEP